MRYKPRIRRARLLSISGRTRLSCARIRILAQSWVMLMISVLLQLSLDTPIKRHRSSAFMATRQSLSISTIFWAPSAIQRGSSGYTLMRMSRSSRWRIDSSRTSTRMASFCRAKLTRRLLMRNLSGHTLANLDSCTRKMI